MLFNKTVTLVAGTSYEVPAHATGMSWYAVDGTAKIFVSPDNINFYLRTTLIGGSEGLLYASVVAYPYTKFTTVDGATVQLGICTHKHGS